MFYDISLVGIELKLNMSLREQLARYLMFRLSQFKVCFEKLKLIEERLDIGFDNWAKFAECLLII